MRTIILTLLVLIFSPVPALAQEAEDSPSDRPELQTVEQYFRGEVLEVSEKDVEAAPGYFQTMQVVRMKILSGPDKGQEIEAQSLVTQDDSAFSKAYAVAEGDVVVVGKTQNLDATFYYIADKYRLPSLAVIMAVFFAIAVWFGRTKGLRSILGLAFSIYILAAFVVPRILQGGNPLAISLLGAFVIAVVSIYLAHGFARRTTVALASTLVTLVLAAGLSWIFVFAGKLFGFGSEEAFYLQAFPGIDINLQGLLIGGIIIGTLGVLDDVTTSQAAAVEEISRANPDLTVGELYKRGLSVGHEHIAALINTLALAYAGAALPLFLLFTVNDVQPLWTILNSELVSEEVIRTLVGSTALIFAVPVATFLAAYWLRQRKQS